MEQETVLKQDYLKLVDQDFETSIGWIDMRGNFYPCEYYGHDDKIVEMLDAGFAPGTNPNDAENLLVRSSGGSFYSYVKVISPRARLTIETLIEKYNMLRTGEVVMIGKYEFWNENGRAKSRLA